MKQAACYIRVSTDDQTEYSPDSQLKMIMDYSKKNNITLENEYIYKDDGISGRQADKRPGFMQMIATAKKKPKPFDVILVYSFSRFARNREDAIFYKTMLRKKMGIDVVSITQPLSEGKESILMEAIYEAMDEYYSLDLAENSLRGKIEKASRGEHQGNPPYGYKYNKDTKSLEIYNEHAEIVKMIFNEFANSPDNSIKSIVRKLNGMGIRTTRGNMWVDRNIHIILRNPAYIGMTRFTVGGMKRNWNNPNTRIVKGKHQPIIDIKLWDICSAKMINHDLIWFKYKKPQVKQEHWLRGILKCDNCGSTLVKNKSYGRAKAHFQCTGYTKGKCEISHHIREEVVVSAILNQLKKDFTEKININISDKQFDNSDQIIIFKNSLAKIDEKEKRIKLAYENEIDTIEEYKQNKSRLKSDRLELEKLLTETLNKNNIEKKKNEIFKKCELAYNILTDVAVSHNDKYEIAHLLFEKIIYIKSANKLIIYYK